jgi:D-arabinono-1,4-lactone oxidase/FAD binding domain
MSGQQVVASGKQIYEDDEGVQWANWAGNVSGVFGEVATPSNLAEVQKLVRENQGNTVRAVGTGHSWSPLVVANNGILVDLSKFTDNGRKAWRWQSNGHNLVSYVPSARWQDVRDALMTPQVTTSPRMYLSTTGPLMTINATGFVAAGCHGTGWHQPTVSDLIYAIEFVGADGQLHVFSEETTPADMPTVRVNLGTLGIITKVTLRVEPLYRLHDEEMIVPTANIMGPNPARTDGEIRPDNLHKLLTENEYVELFWFPGSGFDGELWVKKFNRTTDDLRDIPLRPDGWVDQMADAIMGWTAEHPFAQGLVLSQAWKTIKDRAGAIQAKGGFVAEAPRVLFYADRAFPVLDLEVAVPIPSTGPSSWDVSNVINAWYAGLNFAYAAYSRDGSYPLTCCLHARFTKGSQSLLSPVYTPQSEDRWCWIEVLGAYPKSDPDSTNRRNAMSGYMHMANVLMPTWIGQMHGRPHWAKNWQYIEPKVNMKSLFPASNLDTFNALRRRLDPNGMFVNDFLTKQALFQ